MAKTHHKTLTVDLDPDRLVEVLTAPEFQEAREKAQDALEVSYKELRREGDKLVYEVHVTQYARTKTGVDKSKTEQAVTTYDWDLTARRATWVYVDPHSDRVTVKGSVRVEPKGAGSTLVDDMEVSVKVPLVGGQIEKLIVKEVAKGWPKYEAVLQKAVADAKG